MAEEPERSVQEFLTYWSFLAEDGNCDGPYGMEYNRVLRRWQQEGRPDDIPAFILKHANYPPLDKSGK